MAHPITLTHSGERDAIVDALNRFIIAIDSDDRTMFTSSWATTSEPVFDMGNGTVMNGMEEINSQLMDRVGPLDTQHMLNTVRVDHKNGADQAYVTAYALAQHYRAGEGMDPASQRLLAGASYFVDVVRDSGDKLWKIKKFQMKIIWVEGDWSVIYPSQA